MRVAFIGCVEFSFRTLEHVMALKEAEVVGVVTRSESPFNADFRSLEPLAKEAGISTFIAKGNDQREMARWLEELKPDVIYCFGWSYLLKEDILGVPPLGVIGYHPAALPKNRGRHPIIWPLALGLKETASTFFFMDEGADSGDILSQKATAIEDGDDAATLYDKLTALSLEQIGEFTSQLASGSFPKVRQDHSKANCWRKRTEKDGLIDWRMSSRTIHNLIRALTRPYVGAHCIYNDEDMKIWKSEVVDTLYGDTQNIEPGKVLEAEGRDVVVKCGEGALKLTLHEFKVLPEKGVYL